jgi:hypothetical protein
LIELQRLAIDDYIYRTWHILPSPNPHSFVHIDNGPPCLNPLNTKVIQWDIPKNRICILESFGGISFGLGKIIQFGILIQKLPLCGKGSISHIKLLVILAIHDYIYLDLLPTSTMQGCQCSLPSNITLLGGQS